MDVVDSNPHDDDELGTETASNEAADLTLGARDTTVLQVLEEERLKSFSFEGLKRALGVHPETLSRALDRLEEQGVVEKTSQGYRVTSKGEDVLRLQPVSAANPGIPLLRTLLPDDVAIQQTVLDLKGKWFGGLRWLGYSQSTAEIILKWVTEDGGIRMDAKFADGELNIEAKLQTGTKDLSEAVRAAHQLMSYITKIYSRLEQVTTRIAYLKLNRPSAAAVAA